MSIISRIESDMKDAMRARDKERLGALRMLLSPLKLSEKEAAGEFGEQQEIAVLMTEKKKRLQSAEAFRGGGREEQAKKEEREAAIIDSYLPQALSEGELAELVDEAIGETGAAGPKDMGRVMSAVMPKVAGRADGKVVSAMVRGRLKG